MTILYRGPHALVTPEMIATVHVGWRRLPVRDLGTVQIVRVRLDGSRRLLGLSALLVAVMTVPVAGWPPAVVLAAAAAGLVMRRHRDRWNLTAEHSGARAVLFTSTDQREFDQVCRALRRAVERQAEMR